MATEVKIAGRCPMGCGETLFVGTGGHITCSFGECPNPRAATELLSPEATEQRQEEETEMLKRLEVARKRGKAIEREAETLVEALRGQWWLEAAAAHSSLDQLLRNGDGDL